MGRHTLRESAPTPSVDELPVVTPHGGDGFDMPTQFFPAVGNVSRPIVEPGHIRNEHLSPRVSIGLGARAVGAAMDKTYWQLRDKNTEREEQIQAKEVGNFREWLTELTPKRAKKLNSMFVGNPPQWLRERLGLGDGNKGVVSILARNIQKYDISDETIINFLEWHNSKLAEKQAELDAQIAQYKQGFSDDMQAAMEAGWIEEVPANLKRVDKTTVVADDGLKTSLREGQPWNGGTHQHSNMVMISPQAQEEPFQLKRLLRHEFTHVVQGVDRAPDGSVSGKGGLYRLFGKGRGGSVVNEAAVEHFANSLLVGDLDTMDPEVRRAASYPENRGLLYGLSSFGVHPIDMRYFTKALFENRNAPQQEDRDGQSMLQEQLRRAFPFTDVVKEISQFDDETDVAEYTEKLRRRARAYKLKKVIFGKKSSPRQRTAV